MKLSGSEVLFPEYATPSEASANSPRGSVLICANPVFVLIPPRRPRPVSAAQQPAFVDAPGAQFRKNLWPLRNHRPKLDFWGCRKSFRNWGLGSEEKAGIFNQPGLPNITGGWTGDFSSGHYGAFSSSQMSSYGIGNGSYGKMKTTMDASRCSPIYGRATTVMPSSINQPIILYLGRPA